MPDNNLIKNIPAQTAFTKAELGLEDALGKPDTGAISALDNSENVVGNAAGGTATEIKDFLEHMPEFPGGTKHMYDFIRRHLRYPNEAQRLGLEGMVVVTFVVDKNGEISDIKVIKYGGATAEEAIRVIRNRNPWQPGRQNG